MNTHPLDLRQPPPAAPLRATPPPEDYLDLALVLRAVRRQMFVGALVVALCAGLAVAFALSLPERYTSHATVLLDEDRAELLDLISELPSAALRDASVQSEVEVIKSQELALRVVDRLGLVDTPELLAQDPSPVLAAISGLKRAVMSVLDPPPVSTGGAPPDEEARREALRQRLALLLRSDLTVQRVGRSYVLALSFEAPTAGLAQEVLGAYVATYLAFGQQANASASDAAVDWLRARTDALRDQALEANRVLETYRLENGLISVGSMLLSEKHLEELTSALIQAEAEAARASAFAEQARAAVEAGPEAALVSLSLSDGGGADAISTRLKEEYLDASRQHQRIIDRFGADHPEAVRLGVSVEEAQGRIFDEVSRAAGQASNMAKVAASRVDALEAGIVRATTRSADDARHRYRVSQLEQTAESYRDLYQSALTRLERTVQQGELPIVAARVLTAPDLPRGASSPSKIKFAALGIVLGTLLAGAVGLARELSRNALDGREDLERLVGLPLIATARARTGWTAGWWGGRKGPSFERALRAIKIAVDDSQPNSESRSVAFLAARPGEGATSLALGFAEMLADHGLRTVLVDADPAGRRSATRSAAGGDGASLVDLLEREGDEDLPMARPRPDLTIVPAAPADDPDSGAVFARTGAMSAVLHSLSRDAAYVIFDLPPATDGADAQAFAVHVSAAVVVHRRAGARAVRDVTAAPVFSDRVLGAVLV